MAGGRVCKNLKFAARFIQRININNKSLNDNLSTLLHITAFYLHCSQFVHTLLFKIVCQTNE
jgi:hypothetical protein